MFCFLTQFGHTHSIPRSSISTPIAFVTFTHFPWNQSSHLSQQIIKRLLCGCRQIHHKLENKNINIEIPLFKSKISHTDMDRPLNCNFHPSRHHLPHHHLVNQLVLVAQIFDLLQTAVAVFAILLL